MASLQTSAAEGLLAHQDQPERAAGRRRPGIIFRKRAVAAKVAAAEAAPAGHPGDAGPAPGSGPEGAVAQVRRSVEELLLVRVRLELAGGGADDRQVLGDLQ